jgi:hypothetical protein
MHKMLSAYPYVSDVAMKHRCHDDARPFFTRRINVRLAISCGQNAMLRGDMCFKKLRVDTVVMIIARSKTVCWHAAIMLLALRSGARG